VSRALERRLSSRASVPAASSGRGSYSGRALRCRGCLSGAFIGGRFTRHRRGRARRRAMFGRACCGCWRPLQHHGIAAYQRCDARASDLTTKSIGIKIAYGTRTLELRQRSDFDPDRHVQPFGHLVSARLRRCARQNQSTVQRTALSSSTASDHDRFRGTRPLSTRPVQSATNRRAKT
jgi:hypothetical protein